MAEQQPQKPRSAFEKFVSVIARVPKAEADAAEAEEAEKKRPDQNRPEP